MMTMRAGVAKTLSSRAKRRDLDQRGTPYEHRDRVASLAMRGVRDDRGSRGDRGARDDRVRVMTGVRSMIGICVMTGVLAMTLPYRTDL